MKGFAPFSPSQKFMKEGTGWMRFCSRASSVTWRTSRRVSSFSGRSRRSSGSTPTSFRICQRITRPSSYATTDRSSFSKALVSRSRSVASPGRSGFSGFARAADTRGKVRVSSRTYRGTISSPVGEPDFPTTFDPNQSRISFRSCSRARSITHRTYASE